MLDAPPLPAALALPIAATSGWFAAFLHRTGLEVASPAHPRLGSTLRDLANAAAMTLLAAGLHASGLAGPAALLASGTLLIFCETWRHSEETRSRWPSTILTIGAMACAAWPDRIEWSADWLARTLGP